VTSSGWGARIRAELDRVEDEGRWRAPREFDAKGPRGRLRLGAGPPADVVSFASNDYLGLSAHSGVVAAAHDALARWGAGSGASRLVTGSRPIHTELEQELAEWKGTEAAVCFPTGFAANLGTLCALGGRDVRVFSDELNHASIIDGCRLSRSTLAVYRHRDADHLRALLCGTANAAGRGGSAPTGSAAAAGSDPAIVVTDTIFSMDGDAAPLEDLADACADHDTLLLLDEAHAVLGPHPPPRPAGRPELVRIGTLSKTLGSLGGFVAASRDVVDLLVNLARPYIFSTALTPADAAAALAAVRILRSDEGASLTGRLAVLVGRMAEAGLVPPDHPSPIIPIVLGSEERAIQASAALLEEGLWVPAIRPPTVPVGTSRLRVTLSAAHDDEDVNRLIDALGRLVGPDAATTSVHTTAAPTATHPSRPEPLSAPAVA
jgi:8-amino-7-oxononanoate synthase